MDKILQQKLKEFAEQNNLNYYDIVEACYRERDIQYAREDIIWWLGEEAAEYVNDENMINAILNEYFEGYDCNYGVWDNIKRAYYNCLEDIPL